MFWDSKNISALRDHVGGSARLIDWMEKVSGFSGDRRNGFNLIFKWMHYISHPSARNKDILNKISEQSGFAKKQAEKPQENSGTCEKKSGPILPA